jgi:Protein of unknown function (DUF3305)
MEKPTKTLAVIMQRRNARSRWAGVIWEPVSVHESGEPRGAARLLMRQDDTEQWLHPGFELAIHRDEIEGYYLNVSTGSPRVFVLWRMEEDQGDLDAAREGQDAARGVPLQVTASYEEGGRWLDGGQSVDSVTMPPAIFGWIGEYVEQNYRPEPKKRIKPRSFMHPKDRIGR